MSVFSSFSKTDKKILGGSIIILLVLSYLLYDDSLLFPNNRHGELQAIGTISTSSNDVRRKNSDNFIWLPGNKKDEIYNRDSIFTGDHSQAAIQLQDGTVIQIQENSLVNLNMKNGQMQLDLRFGQFVGTGNQPLLIKTGDEEYTIDGKDAKFEINRAQNGALDLKVLQGNAEIKGKKGNQSLKSNESLQITKDTTEKTEAEGKITLVTADDLPITRVSPKAPLNFEWKSQGPLKQYQLELATSEDFKKVLVVHTSTEKKARLTDSLEEATYFWRVKGLDIRNKTVTTSETRKFALSYLKAPVIQTPEEKQILSQKALNTPEDMKLAAQVTWNAEDKLVSFEWQLAKDSDFTSIVGKKSSGEKSLFTARLESGTYFTRVRGFDKNKHASAWSEARSFQVNMLAEERPTAPHLTEKHIRFEVPKLDRAPSAETSPKFGWTKVDGAKDYQWEIANNPNFTGPQKATTPATRLAWTQYKPGKYYYRVLASSPLGQKSDYSDVGTMDIYGAIPVVNPIASVLVKDTNKDATAPTKETKASWAPMPDAASYVVQVDKSPEFTAPRELQVKEPAVEVPMTEPGKYYVRVKALNQAGQEISEFSKPQETTYNFHVTLKTPELIEPYDKTTIFLQRDTEPLIWLEWGSVPSATRYILEISAKPNFSEIAVTKEIAGTRFLLKDRIPYGRVYWRIRAVAQENDLSSEWSNRQFLLLHQKNNGF